MYKVQVEMMHVELPPCPPYLHTKYYAVELLQVAHRVTEQVF